MGKTPGGHYESLNWEPLAPILPPAEKQKRDYKEIEEVSHIYETVKGEIDCFYYKWIAFKVRLF